MYDKWVCHFHVGQRRTPVTLYYDGRVYELWHGKMRWCDLDIATADRLLGGIIRRAKRISA